MPATPTCAHIQVTGRRCPAAPLPGRQHCHFHHQAHQSELLPGMPGYRLPICEDSRSLMLATQQIAQAQLDGLIDLKLAGKLLHCLSLMASLIRRPDFAQTAPEPAQPYHGEPRNMTEFVLQLLNQPSNRRPHPAPDDDDAASTHSTHSINSTPSPLQPLHPLHTSSPRDSLLPLRSRLAPKKADRRSLTADCSLLSAAC